jgi:hypothetical protein
MSTRTTFFHFFHPTLVAEQIVDFWQSLSQLESESISNSNLSNQSEQMTQPHQEDKDRFLYPCSRYYGQIKPENLVFK